MVSVDIELLVVPDCPHEAPALVAIEAALGVAGVDADVITTVIETEDQARERGFTGSPTVLVNGRDPFFDPGAPVGFACRMYRTPDGLAGVPPVDGLLAALREPVAG